jgi:predicted N-formylglutamate amidohydrolase
LIGASLSRRGERPCRLLLTCEHGGNRIPREYASLFRGAAAQAVDSHRGWDPGALDLARRLGRTFDVPVHAVTWCRLLVDSNRAPSNPRIWSEYTSGLERADKLRILERYWWPHRRVVEARIAAHVARRDRVLHVAVHSFVPVISGVRRNADLGLLYDSRRRAERKLCSRWEAILQARNPELRVRRNYPYIGATDGLPTWLRRRHAPRSYLGVELEINQAFLANAGVPRVHRVIARSLEELLGATSR